jgi:hypothetical protein
MIAGETTAKVFFKDAGTGLARDEYTSYTLHLMRRSSKKPPQDYRNFTSSIVNRKYGDW